MSEDVFLVTGALGCVGSWVVRNLLIGGERVIAVDLSDDVTRLGLILSPEDLARLPLSCLDITSTQALQQLADREKVTHIIHLAALQIPLCTANPPMGARLNVEGTVNVFETARALAGQVRMIVYSSSIAVFGPPDHYPPGPVSDDAHLLPGTLYGVYKQADEGLARVYLETWGVKSIGLRPHTVFGIGRDQGLTSGLTKALLAAAANCHYRIPFGGSVALQYVDDVAKIILACARAGASGAEVCNLRNDVVTVREYVQSIKDEIPRADITWDETNVLPFPADFADRRLRAMIGEPSHTPLGTAVKETLAGFRSLLRQQRIDTTRLGS